MPSFESFKNYVIISCYPLKRLQRYYIFFNWQNVFLSFSFFCGNILLRMVIFFFNKYTLSIILIG